MGGNETLPEILSSVLALFVVFSVKPCVLGAERIPGIGVDNGLRATVAFRALRTLQLFGHVFSRPWMKTRPWNQQIASYRGFSWIPDRLGPKL